jgi:hypothetical protein
MGEKVIPEHLWLSLLTALNGDRRHDTGVIRGFCRFHKYSSKAVWTRALAEAREVAELEPRRVLH